MAPQPQRRMLSSKEIPAGDMFGRIHESIIFASRVVIEPRVNPLFRVVSNQYSDCCRPELFNPASNSPFDHVRCRIFSSS